MTHQLVFIRYSLLTIGAIIQGIGMAYFLFPHGIPSGGAAGIAIILNHWLPLSLGFSLWFANFSLLITAIYSFGMAWTIRTMFAVSVTALTVQLINTYLYIPHFNLLLDIILGALTFGIGVGILIRCGASSGGMVIPALVIASLRNYSPGKTMFWLNLTIFGITAAIIEWKIVFLAVICQYFSTRTIDFIYHLKIDLYRIYPLLWRK